MERLALILAFIGAGTGIIIQKVCEHLNLEPFPFLDLILCIPAVLLGTWSWLKTPSFARSWPVVACVLAVWFGIIHADATASNRRFLIAAYLTTPLPLAALIVEQRAWWLCAKTFVFVSVIVLAIATWFECDLSQGTIAFPDRLGTLRNASGVPLSNPNQMAGQLAAASVLASLLFLHGSPRNGRVAVASLARHTRRYLTSSILLGLGCFLTASRGGFVAWFTGTSVLFLFGTKGLPINRLRDLVALAGMLFALSLFIATAAGLAPWERIQNRFIGENAGSIGTFGGRQEIWSSAFRVWLSDPVSFFIGAGTGIAEERIGELLPETAVSDQYGQSRRSVHNAFFEWLASLGLLGIIPGTCMLLMMFHRAYQWDSREGTMARVALLLTISLYSCTSVSYREHGWLAIASLILAMLSPSPRANGGRAVRPPCHTKQASIPPLHRRPMPTGSQPCVPRTLGYGIHRPHESSPPSDASTP